MPKPSSEKILLTSAGFQTEAIRRAFLDFSGKAPEEIKVLFIPTAAIFPDAIAVLPKCLGDLLKSGIPAENIAVFDLHKSLSPDELSAFDAVYFAGGNTKYLLERINDSGFREPLCGFVENGGVYIGVSAGSVAAAGNLPGNLGFLNASLRVHRETGTPPGVFDNSAVSQIDLTDFAAVSIRGGLYEII